MMTSLSTPARVVEAWHQLGLRVGHASDPVGATGCTVLLGTNTAFRCASALLGRASATRELETCAPTHLVDRTDAILLTGGSAYGLDAAAGVMRWLEERGRGFPVGGGVVPIVPAASLFDLAPLGQFAARPDAALARAACTRALDDLPPDEGSVGAGTGALVGKARGVAHAMKGGVGMARADGAPGFAVALAAVNAFGDVRDAEGRIIAGARDDHGGFADAERLLREDGGVSRFAATRGHTTLVIVAVSAAMPKAHLAELAHAATAALHRRITPVGTAWDGDVIFAVSPLDLPDASAPALTVVQRQAFEMLAVHAVADAIERAVRTARGRDGIPGLADATFPHASYG